MGLSCQFLGASLCLVLVGIGGGERLVERLVHIEIFPSFGACTGGDLECHLLSFLLDIDFSHAGVVVKRFYQVGLGQKQSDGFLSFDLLDLRFPPCYALKRSQLVASDTDDEGVRSRVLDLAVHTKMFIAGRVMDLNFNLLLLHVLDALVDIQDSWLIVIREGVVEVVRDEARFTGGGVPC